MTRRSENGFTNIILGLYLIFNLFGCYDADEIYGPQPQIQSSNGHLKFAVGENKNLSFVTSGRGTVQLNGYDLQPTLQMGSSAAKTVAQFREALDDVQAFEKTFTDSAVLDRLAALEATNASSGFVPNSNFNFQQIDQRLNELQRKLSEITALLTNNECTSNPCRNGGICKDVFNGFICKCQPEWEGPYCDIDVNECARFAGTDLGCQNGATCINKQGGYTCECASGWFGLHCTRRSATCDSGSNSGLCGYGTCVPDNSPQGYKCICDHGWTTEASGLACTKDVDECKSNQPSCSVNPPVPCINLPGSFYCGSCPAGYSGNGYYCIDIDECAVNNGGCSTNPKVQCINTMGSSTCGLCPPGYVGDGKTCTYQGLCQVNNGGCHPLASCMELPGSTTPSCTCPPGYAGTGLGPNGCGLSNATNPCASNPCVHGSCQINVFTRSFYCTCSQNYTGRNCDQLSVACNPNPCLNGGICRNNEMGYYCSCLYPFMGKHCDRSREDCSGRFNDPSGVIKYPASNESTYQPSMSCSWIIETTLDKVINITFKRFNLEKTNGCSKDWLQIHDGLKTATKNLGRFCGDVPPKGGNILTTANAVHFWFRSDTSVEKDGFELVWNATAPICGESMDVTSHGTITSPGSPGNYPNNRDCYWHLKAPTARRIEFHFFSVMIGNSKNCSGDYIEFLSGLLPSDPSFAQYCSSTQPEPLISPWSEVTVHFHSDATETFPGFQISYSVIEGIPGCGGVYTSDKGELRSLESESDLLCEYKIKIRPNYRIKISVTKLNVVGNYCDVSYLAIYEGNSVDSPMVGKYCSINNVAPFSSNGNELLVVFKSNNQLNNFEIKYTTVCHKVFTSEMGVIDAGNSAVECVYEIIQPIGRVITLTLIDMKDEFRRICNSSILEIRDGNTENSTLLNDFCKNPSGTLISSYNHLWIKFTPRFNYTFRANYTTTDIGCGGIITSNSGTFTSPGYPNKYSNNLHCTWIISAPSGSVVQLTFMTFQLEWSRDCLTDYLLLYDKSIESFQIGRYCGSVNPPSVLTTSNMMIVIFVTGKARINTNGFMVSYVYVPEDNVCGGTFFSSYGVIKSPNYPKNYPDNKECTWEINVPVGQQILLNVTAFEMEEETLGQCKYDHLEIRNGGSSASPLIGKFCDNKIPNTITSHTNKLFLKFKSDVMKTYRGFYITWESTSTGCGGLLTSPEGIIISPNYPEPYNEYMQCSWKIVTSIGSLIQIVFADLDMEPQTHCTSDYVKIFDGKDRNAKVLGTYCTTHPDRIISSSNVLFIQFVSDVNRQGRGFNLKYTTVCNNTLKGFRGVIESPNYPNTFPNDLYCLWKIEVSPSNKINITITDVQIERRPIIQFGAPIDSCNSSYLEVSETDDDEGTDIDLKGRYCKTTTEPFLISINTNIALVKFVSGPASTYGRGFRIEWHIEGCGGELTSPQGTITSPNYPNLYSAKMECNWIITAPYGHSIQIDIVDVDMDTSPSCTDDYLAIYSGRNASFPELAKICSKRNKSMSLTPSSMVIFLHFETDYRIHGRGFKLNYKFIDSRCGGKLSTPSGTFHSPNYPSNFAAGDRCDWVIEVDKNHLIQLTFEDLSLPLATHCDTYIKVYDGDSTSARDIVKICNDGKSKNVTILKSTSNTMYVQFFSAKYFIGKGFKASYKTACGARIVTNISGIISYNSTLDICQWTIIAGRLDQHVYLTFTHFNIMCRYNNTNTLRLFNGEDDSSPEISVTLCDTKIPPTIVSTGNAIHISLEEEHNIYFTATYTVIDSECGATLESEEGAFTSPGYPNNYPVSTACEWTIKVAPGNGVRVFFKEFKLMTSLNCNEDYLEIREKSSSGKLLGLFCGHDLPSNITSQGDMWIMFNSVNSTRGSSGATDKGFLASFYLTHGMQLSGSSGEIASPLYPRSYADNNAYEWTITVPFGFRIAITFLDIYIDYGEEKYEAFYESYLMFYDGHDNTAPELKTIRQITIPPPLESSSNVVFIKFQNRLSNGAGSRFHLKWQQIEKPNTEIAPLKPNVGGCRSETVREVVSNREYTVTSPGYPYGYAPNLECEWIFSTKPDSHLAIAFKSIDLEINPNSGCLLDVVKIYSGLEDGMWELKETVCLPNATNGPSIKTSNLMKVAFTSDSYANQSGFMAVIHRECGGTLKDVTNGIISIPNNTLHSKWYIPEEGCQWNISARSGRRILVEFLEMSLGSDENNCETYVLIKNGQYPDSPFLGKGKYCGNKIPEAINTTGNHLHVQFAGLNLDAKFKLRYSELSTSCLYHIVLQKEDDIRYITSPNYPNIPSPHSECEWVIRATPGESLQLDFEDNFDFTYSNDCSKESVEVRDGGTELSPLVGKYCNKPPDTIHSTDNLLYIKFRTDVNYPKTGFKAKVSIATCGGIVRAEKGFITSPFYGQSTKFPSGANCTWRIIAPDNLKLHLKFEEFDIDSFNKDNCKTAENYVTITEKLGLDNQTDRTLGTFCGTVRPTNIITTSGFEVTVKFVTRKEFTDAHGFKLSFNTTRNSCSEDFNAEYGIITTPGYPNVVQVNRLCHWIITVPKGRRVKVEVWDYDRTYWYVHSSGIGFHDGSLLDGASIEYKGEKIVRSSDNKITAFYWTSDKFRNRGAKLSFTSDEPTICLGDFNMDSGTITNPNVTNSTYHCQWERRSTNIHTTVAVIIDVILRSDDLPRDCGYTSYFAEIMVDTEDNRRILCIASSKQKREVAVSPFPITKITASKHRNDTLIFTATYKTYPCGGIVTAPSGTISSPGYPRKYNSSENIYCAWSLTSEEAIKINFISFNLDDCERSYVTIYNGELPTSPRIGKYCGTQYPDVIISQENKVFIEYFADKESSSNSFSLDYEPKADGCGGTFHDKSKTIESPNYPKNYPPNAECEWEVQATIGNHINLIFTDRFQIEKSTDCKNDFVQVFDYVNDNWVSMAKLCGRDIPRRLNSTSTKMKILFRSNGNITGVGFKAQWETHCGGTLKATSTPQYILSPGYPHDIQNGLYCVYNITAPKKFINVIFEEYDVTAATDDYPLGCNYDNVTIIHTQEIGLTITKPILFCKFKYPRPIRLQDSLSMTFYTNRWFQKKAFKVKFYTDECGGEITNPAIISTPKSNALGNSQQTPISAGEINCIWNITAPKDKNIVIRFEKLELEYNIYCTYDYIDIYEGLQINSTNRKALLCGNLTHNLPVIKSDTNQMLIRLKSDYSNQFSGFRAAIYFTYGPTIGCGGNFNITKETTIEIPTQLSGIDCQWVITTIPGKVLKISFDYMRMAHCQNGSSCHCYVEIRDGSGPFSQLIDRVSNGTSKEYTTFGQSVWISIYDMTQNTNSVKIRLKPVNSVCGSTLIMVGNQTGTLTSPSYPNKYPSNTRCSWTLKAPEYRKVYVRFVEFDLADPGDATSCNMDRVEITDKSNIKNIETGLGSATVYNKDVSTTIYGGNRSPIGTHQFCGANATMFDYYSTRNELVIQFISGHENRHGKGFKIEYKVAGCDRNYTGIQGRLIDDKLTEECHITITVPANRTISLYFNSFYIFGAKDCSTSGLEIHDGDKIASVAKFCGYTTPTPIFSTGNKIKIRVWNKVATFGSFYDISYTSTEAGRGCGGILYNYVGSFTSPMHPSPYKKESICEWEVIVPMGLEVALKFSTYDVQGPCSSDYITVTTFSGGAINKHKFCKEDTPATLRSDNRLLVQYKTSSNNEGSGWIAQFIAVTSDTKLKW